MITQLGGLATLKWDAAELEARLCSALDIAKRALQLFAAEGYADSEVPENSFRPEKPIAESAMLIYAASEARHLPGVAGRIEEIARLLIPHARSARTMLNIALHPSLCFDLAVPHILLTKLGYPDKAFDDLLQFCLSSESQYGHERPPFASLEQRWIRSLWTGAEPRRDWRPDLVNSMLHQPLEILGGLRQDAYAFTHLIMYCTDFGFRPAYFTRPQSVILGEAESLLAKCMDDEDYDLAAEVLLAWPLTGMRWCASAAFCFRVLARVEDKVGVLPGGTTRADRLSKLHGKERTQYAFGTAYHTALVMGLICAASLRPGRAPSIRLTGPKVESFVLDRLLRLIEQDQGHWQLEFSELVDFDKRRLAPFLLDVAIAQKYRKHDYEGVCELLMTASEYGLAKSTLCAQAAQLLERLAHCSHAIKSRTNGAA